MRDPRINGRIVVEKRDPNREPVYTCRRARGDEPPPEWHARTPDPDDPQRVIYWFWPLIGVLMIGCMLTAAVMSAL